MRRRSRSMSMILTITESPTWTTCSGISTWRSASSEMCTRPSMPSSTRTKEPNGTSLVTLPGTIWPIWWVRAKCCQGSSCVAFSDRETRSRSMSTSSTSTVTSSPTATTSLGWSMCFQDSSETCTRPSTPPRSTNAPKFTIEETTPVRTWPLASLLRNSLRTSDWVCSSHCRRDRTTLLRFLSSSMIFASSSRPTQGDVEDETALDDLDDGAGDDLVGFLLRLDRAPGALVLCALLGQDQAAFLVLLLEDESFHLVADLDDLVGVDVVLDGQLARGDDALGLVADVQQHLVPVDLDDDALDDVAIVEVLDRLVGRGEEVLGGADVVHRDLGGGAVRTDLGGGHVVECSGRGVRRDGMNPRPGGPRGSSRETGETPPGHGRQHHRPLAHFHRTDAGGAGSTWVDRPARRMRRVTIGVP